MDRVEIVGGILGECFDIKCESSDREVVEICAEDIQSDDFSSDELDVKKNFKNLLQDKFTDGEPTLCMPTLCITEQGFTEFREENDESDVLETDSDSDPEYEVVATWDDPGKSDKTDRKPEDLITAINNLVNSHFENPIEKNSEKSAENTNETLPDSNLIETRSMCKRKRHERTEINENYRKKETVSNNVVSSKVNLSNQEKASSEIREDPADAKANSLLFLLLSSKQKEFKNFKTDYINKVFSKCDQESKNHSTNLNTSPTSRTSNFLFCGSAEKNQRTRVNKAQTQPVLISDEQGSESLHKNLNNIKTNKRKSKKVSKPHFNVSEPGGLSKHEKGVIKQKPNNRKTNSHVLNPQKHVSALNKCEQVMRLGHELKQKTIVRNILKKKTSRKSGRKVRAGTQQEVRTESIGNNSILQSCLLQKRTPGCRKAGSSKNLKGQEIQVQPTIDKRAEQTTVNVNSAEEILVLNCDEDTFKNTDKSAHLQEKGSKDRLEQVRVNDGGGNFHYKNSLGMCTQPPLPSMFNKGLLFSLLAQNSAAREQQINCKSVDYIIVATSTNIQENEIQTQSKIHRSAEETGKSNPIEEVITLDSDEHSSENTTTMKQNPHSQEKENRHGLEKIINQQQKQCNQNKTESSDSRENSHSKNLLGNKTNMCTQPPLIPIFNSDLLFGLLPQNSATKEQKIICNSVNYNNGATRLNIQENEIPTQEERDKSTEQISKTNPAEKVISLDSDENTFDNTTIAKQSVHLQEKGSGHGLEQEIHQQQEQGNQNQTKNGDNRENSHSKNLLDNNTTISTLPMFVPVPNNGLLFNLLEQKSAATQQQINFNTTDNKAGSKNIYGKAVQMQGEANIEHGNAEVNPVEEFLISDSDEDTLENTTVQRNSVCLEEKNNGKKFEQKNYQQQGKSKESQVKNSDSAEIHNSKSLLGNKETVSTLQTLIPVFNNGLLVGLLAQNSAAAEPKINSDTVACSNAAKNANTHEKGIQKQGEINKSRPQINPEGEVLVLDSDEETLENTTATRNRGCIEEQKTKLTAEAINHQPKESDHNQAKNGENGNSKNLLENKAPNNILQTVVPMLNNSLLFSLLAHKSMMGTQQINYNTGNGTNIHGKRIQLHRGVKNRIKPVEDVLIIDSEEDTFESSHNQVKNNDSRRKRDSAWLKQVNYCKRKRKNDTVKAQQYSSISSSEDDDYEVRKRKFKSTGKVSSSQKGISKQQATVHKKSQLGANIANSTITKIGNISYQTLDKDKSAKKGKEFNRQQKKEVSNKRKTGHKYDDPFCSSTDDDNCDDENNLQDPRRIELSDSNADKEIEPLRQGIIISNAIDNEICKDSCQPSNQKNEKVLQTNFVGNERKEKGRNHQDFLEEREKETESTRQDIIDTRHTDYNKHNGSDIASNNCNQENDKGAQKYLTENNRIEEKRIHKELSGEQNAESTKQDVVDSSNSDDNLNNGNQRTDNGHLKDLVENGRREKAVNAEELPKEATESSRQDVIGSSNDFIENDNSDKLSNGSQETNEVLQKYTVKHNPWAELLKQKEKVADSTRKDAVNSGHKHNNHPADGSSDSSQEINKIEQEEPVEKDHEKAKMTYKELSVQPEKETEAVTPDAINSSDSDDNNCDYLLPDESSNQESMALHEKGQERLSEEPEKTSELTMEGAIDSSKTDETVQPDVTGSSDIKGHHDDNSQLDRSNSNRDAVRIQPKDLVENNKGKPVVNCSDNVKNCDYSHTDESNNDKLNDNTVQENGTVRNDEIGKERNGRELLERNVELAKHNVISKSKFSENVKRVGVVLTPSVFSARKSNNLQDGWKEFNKQHKSNTRKEMRKKWQLSGKNKCPYCPVMAGKTHLKQHILKKHGEGNDEKFLRCAKCGYMTMAKSVLQRHMLSHFDKSQITEYLSKCDRCPKMFKGKRELQDHIMHVHLKHQLKKYKCMECDHETYYKAQLKKHINAFHRQESWNNRKMLQCLKCSFTTKMRHTLYNHMASKHSQNMIQCEKCPYQASSMDRFNLHIIGHKEVKDEKDLKYRCNKCDYKTYRRYSLIVHKLKHLKPEEVQYFYCYHCDFKSKRKDNLKAHIYRSHLREHFICYICTFSADSQNALIRHVDEHSKNQ